MSPFQIKREGDSAAEYLDKNANPQIAMTPSGMAAHLANMQVGLIEHFV